MFNIVLYALVDRVVIGKIRRYRLLEDDIFEIPDCRDIGSIDGVFGNEITEGLFEFADYSSIFFLSHFHYPNIISSFRLTYYYYQR